MPQRVLRFGIRDDQGMRAATWKLWTEAAGGKSELYLACRAPGGALKASLHESGRWHVAYSRETFEKRVKDALPGKDRFIQRWSKPPEIDPGVTLAYRIVTPWSAPTIPVEAESRKDFVWLPNAPEPNATEIDIFIIGPHTTVTNWPGKRSHGTFLVGSFPLENGDTVWAVHWVVPMPDLTKPGSGSGRFYRGRTEADLQSDAVRALVFGEAPDGSRVIYDCPVQGRRRNS